MKEISLSEAFAYCFTQPSYIISLICGLVVAALLFGYAIKRYNTRQELNGIGWAAIIVATVIAFSVVLARPTSVRANTTTEQAARGVYIG